MAYATDSDEDNDIVFLGDSSLRCDVRTIQFEQETGLKAYNLGNAGLIAISDRPDYRSLPLSLIPSPG